MWFGRPQTEYVCEETGEEVILMKDRKGRVIGFERLNYPDKSAQPVRVTFETVPQPGVKRGSPSFLPIRGLDVVVTAVVAVLLRKNSFA